MGKISIKKLVQEDMKRNLTLDMQILELKTQIQGYEYLCWCNVRGEPHPLVPWTAHDAEMLQIYKTLYVILKELKKNGSVSKGE